MLFQQRLHGDDRCRQAALHVAGAAAEDLAVPDLRGKGIEAPAGARLDHVHVAVKVQARARFLALAARQHVDPGITRAVARRPLGTQVAHLEAALRQAPPDQLRAGLIGIPRRIDGGNAHHLLGERDDLVTLVFDAPKQPIHNSLLSPILSASSPRGYRELTPEGAQRNGALSTPDPGSPPRSMPPRSARDSRYRTRTSRSLRR